MKKGLDLFVYRELLVFSQRNFDISIFPTKYNPGLYDAHAEWRVRPANMLLALLMQPACFFSAPARYVALLREALAFGAMVEFVLAWYFSRSMQGVDVIYSVFGDRKLFIGYFCKRITGKPLNVTLHAYELYQNPNPKLFVHALDACDQIITVTEYNKELLADKFHVDPARVDVVRISVDMDDFRPAQKFVILIVGFFAEKKGHEILFRAVKQLGMDDIEVWVVGGPLTEAIAVDVEALAKELGVEAQVAFLGALRGNALKAVYHACDVFCLPSRFDRFGGGEGFPTVIAEAMAMGKPVISTRHVEIPRIVHEIVVDENDVDGLAQAIRHVYESPELRRRLGEQNRQIAEATFSNRNAERLADVLEHLATQPTAPRPNKQGTPARIVSE
jgi:glycosyltransferase involved in cell wall biosynthesis